MAHNPPIASLGPAAAHAGIWQRLSHQFHHASRLGMAYSVVIILFYAALFLVPFGVAVWLSFQNWDFIVTPSFAGLDNYARFFTDGDFWLSLGNTLRFGAVEIPVAVGLMLLLALLVTTVRGRGEGLFLSIYYLPFVTPAVVSSYLWRWLYNPSDGVFNTIITSVGLPRQPFLTSERQAIWCITAMIIWINVGAGAVLFTAGIKNIPTSLYEAAVIDGAGFWQRFFRITLPLLRPVLLYEMVVSVIAIAQMFDAFFLMASGKYARPLSLYIYQLGFTSLNLGFGAAVSLFLFLMLLFATVFQMQRFRPRWEY
jgi:multiple sugar transport system permease protein